MIHFDHVSKRYGERAAVTDLTLDVQPGQVFALLGPNGAGKTTTIKMTVGLLRPSSGRVELCGVDVAADPRRACRLLGYVPDVPYLYDKLTGREFLRFVAEMHALGAGSAARVDRQVDEFQLQEFCDDLTESYSHGMKHRLALAAALLHDPPVLVLDEPLVGLDPRHVRLVKDLLCRRAAAGTTILMSTHLLAVAEEIAGRIGIVDRGQLRFEGTCQQLQAELAEHNSSLEQLYLLVTGTGQEAPPQARSSAASTR
jgi:ABC-2 type transport system ATP-binding protein